MCQSADTCGYPRRSSTIAEARKPRRQDIFARIGLVLFDRERIHIVIYTLQNARARLEETAATALAMTAPGRHFSPDAESALAPG